MVRRTATAPNGLYVRGGKRAFDVVVAMLAALCLAPVWMLVGLAVRLRLGSPVLFRQRRSGRLGRPFTIYKFRTMTDRRGPDGLPLPDAERLTDLGRLLRATSLDELPELVNVVRGEMSLVGPRPLLERYLPYYRGEERRRFELRPGITGWAQIRGRNQATWDQRLADDAWYVAHCSLGLDIRILGATLGQVLRRTGVHVDPRSTMSDLDVERSFVRQESPGVRPPSSQIVAG